MRSIAFWALLASVLVWGVSPAFAQVRVEGYYRKDGTYVAPHYRSSPNSSKSDNYSTKGNYNPYTGKKGTQDPYRVPKQLPMFVLPAPIAPQYARPTSPNLEVRRDYVAPQTQLTRTVDVWKCVAATGFTTYLAYPRAGCEQLAVRVPTMGPAAPVAAYPRRTFRGYPCTSDCSGHDAGWKWAERQGIEDPDDCGGYSQSFIEGCEAYAQEQQVEMIDDGECEDEDGDETCD